jgi:hypothetical protein
MRQLQAINSNAMMMMMMMMRGMPDSSITQINRIANGDSRDHEN